MVNNYILLVERYGRSSSDKCETGRYRVGAKTQKEAVHFLRDIIREGSIKVHFQCDPRLEMDADWLTHKTIAREKYLGNGVYQNKRRIPLSL